MFKLNLRSALREAIHLGAFRLWPENMEIKGPFGAIRPFASASFPELSPRAEEALKNLKKQK